MLQVMLDKINETQETDLRAPLLKLLSLYGLFSLEKDISAMYRGGYMNGPEPAALIQETILKLIKEIKNDSISLVDVIAPPDFLMNSVLGKSDGEVPTRQIIQGFSVLYYLLSRFTSICKRPFIKIQIQWRVRSGGRR